VVFKGLARAGEEESRGDREVGESESFLLNSGLLMKSLSSGSIVFLGEIFLLLLRLLFLL